MKIVMLCEFYNETLAFQENILAKYYCKHGHDVVIITSTFESVFDYYTDKHDNSIPEKTYIHEGAKIYKLRFRFNFLNRLRAYTSIHEILQEEKPDLIFIHDIMLNIPECVEYVRANPHCRMIMDYHADYSNSGKNWLSINVLHGVLRKWYLDKARPYLSKIYPVVPDGALFLNKVYKVPYEEMEILPLGADVDLANENKQNNTRNRVRAQLGIRDSELLIFTGGKLEPKKKTEVLFDALRLLDDISIYVIVVGAARDIHKEYMNELRKRSENLNVYFLGWLSTEQIYSYLAASDLAVFPACQSVIWQQAIASGLPLIGGNKGHQDLSYLNLKNNIINPPLEDINPKVFAEAIRYIVKTPGKIKEMSDGANYVAENLLDWNKLIIKTL